MKKLRLDKTVVSTEGGEMVNLASPEGQTANRVAFEKKAAAAAEKKKEIEKSIEQRGMEPLAQTEKRLLQPLQDKLALLDVRLKEIGPRKKSPKHDFTHIEALGSPQEQLINRVRQLEQEETEVRDEMDGLRGKVVDVIQGIAAVARGERPSGKFLRYLSEKEGEAARAVGASQQETKNFRASREELKALADLRALAESG